MGGKRWRLHEEKVFWRVIVPLAPPGHDTISQQAKAKTEDEEWSELAEKMKQEMLARFPGEQLLRNYDHVLCYEHYFQNFKKGNYSPNAERFVKEYRAKLASDIDANGRTSRNTQASSASSASETTQGPNANKTKAARAAHPKARRQQKAGRRLTSSQSKQKPNSASLADDRDGDAEDNDDDDGDGDDDDADDPTQSLAQTGFGNAHISYSQPDYSYKPYSHRNSVLAQQNNLAAFQANQGILPSGFQPCGFPPQRVSWNGYEDHGFRQNVGHSFGDGPAGQDISLDPSGVDGGYTQTGYRQSSGGQFANHVPSNDTTRMIPSQRMIGAGYGYGFGPSTPYTPVGFGRGAQRPDQAAASVPDASAPASSFAGMSPSQRMNGTGTRYSYSYSYNRGPGHIHPFAPGGLGGGARDPAGGHAGNNGAASQRMFSYPGDAMSGLGLGLGHPLRRSPVGGGAEGAAGGSPGADQDKSRREAS